MNKKSESKAYLASGNKKPLAKARLFGGPTRNFFEISLRRIRNTTPELEDHGHFRRA